MAASAGMHAAGASSGPQSFQRLLAQVQEEYWQTAKERARLEHENTELKRQAQQLHRQLQQQQQQQQRQQPLPGRQPLRKLASREEAAAAAGGGAGVLGEGEAAASALQRRGQRLKGAAVSGGEESQSAAVGSLQLFKGKVEDVPRFDTQITFNLKSRADEDADNDSIPSESAPVLDERTPIDQAQRTVSFVPARQRTTSGNESSGVVPLTFTRSASDDEVSCSSRSMRVSANFPGTFPEWWNPLRQANSADVLDSMAMEAVRTSLFDDQPKESLCMLSPVSHLRLLWDFCAALILLYETWGTPLMLFFLKPGTEIDFMTTLDLAILAFFTTDIVLNFNTGSVDRGAIVMNRMKAARLYIRSWFWLDLFATVPYDLILSRGGGVFSSALRILRIFKLLKTLRYLKLMRVKHALENSEKHFVLLTSLKWVWTALATSVALIFFVHVHACVGGAIKHDKPQAETLVAGAELYFSEFRDTFTTIFAGTPLDGQTIAEQCFEMLLLVYRLVLVVGCTTYAVFKCMLHFSERELVGVRTDQTIAYLRQHQVPAKTQIQVLYGLHEAGRAKQMQKDFRQLMDSDLPAQLQRTIMRELWTTKLQTLGLITLIDEWDAQFVPELAALCCEDTFASNSILVTEGDASFSAYCVLSGTVCAFGSRMCYGAMADYLCGMWLGENALVNPSLLRGFTAVTRTLTSVMQVPAEGFHTLLKQLNIDIQFQEWCTNELWKGLCGRCGVLGDHFGDDCPKLHGFATSRASLEAALQGGSEMDFNRKPTREIQEYLKFHRLEKLLPPLKALHVYELQELEKLELDSLKDVLQTDYPNIALTPRDLRALQAKQISRFRADMARGMQSLLHHHPEDEHLIFLSHYKREGGTEAALIRTELQALMRESPQFAVGLQQTSSVFLDSDDLKNLNDVQSMVAKSHNLVLLLTKDVLTRPWCLVEVVTAVQFGVPVILVEVTKPGNEFVFPSDQFYKKLVDGEVLDDAAQEVLKSCEIDNNEVERCLREVFKSITVAFSPHRSVDVRRAELATLLARCTQSHSNKTFPSTRTLSSEQKRSTEYATKALEWFIK